MKNSRSVSTGNFIENYLSYILLILITLLPLLETILNKIFLFTSFSGIDVSHYIKHVVLWICLVGGMITSREGKHLYLSAGINLFKEPTRLRLKSIINYFSVAVSTALSLASLSFLLMGFESGEKVGFIPIHLILIIMPIGFSVITIRFITSMKNGRNRWIPGALGILTGLVIAWHPILSIIASMQVLFSSGTIDSFAAMDILDKFEFIGNFFNPILSFIYLPFLLLLIASAFFGTPIFIILGGAAIILFAPNGGLISCVPDEAYNILKGDFIPAIPLFTLAGFILSESKAGKRLVILFKTILGWFPGGLAVMSVLLCAFLTTFTGGSGVTILALGGILSYALIKSSYKKDFSHGLLTSSGSIGLLFPPSLPIIMYGVVGQISIKKLFVGGMLPGLLMIVILSIIGIQHALKNKVKRTKFAFKRILLPLKACIWEILLPIIILVSYFSGFADIVATSSIAVVYIFIVEVFIKRDIKIKDLPLVFKKCIPIMGGILIILSVAKGLSYYIIDAEIPFYLTEWVQAHIHSKIVFLIMLNLALLITGCFMDIFSAILVVAPLIIPLGQAFGIHPVHLGIIFIANLELGYLTPPVGINLFLASYRFNEPLSKTYKNIIPFFFALLIAVILITYLPFLSTSLLDIIKF